MNSFKSRWKFAVMLAAIVLIFSGQIIQANVVDRNTLTNKIMCGYQGWHAAPGDGNDPGMGWGHWGSGDNIGSGYFHCEIWPDVTEYDSSDLFFTPNTTLINGGTPSLYSPYRQGAVNTHFRWMQENGIDGVFMQRFIVEVRNPNGPSRKHFDKVLQNAMNAATTYGRTFAVEYDISGSDGNLYTDLINDWTHLKNTFNITNHPRYLRHGNRPVIIIWGIGNSGTPQTAQQIIQWFKDEGCFVFGGIQREWRTNTTWASVFRSLNGITPWTVGSYNSWEQINAYRNTVIADLAECAYRNILFMPTAWPRFGWDNMNGDPCGTSHFDPRGGQHLWDQVYAFKSAGATCQFIAMFDEWDEGTAIAKCTDNVPDSGCWLTTDGKGSDWFLRLANQAGKMYRGEISVVRTPLPIVSTASPDNAQIISDTIPTTMTAGQQYNVSVTVKNNGETYWNAETFKLGAVGDYDPFSSSRVTMAAGETLSPNEQKILNFTMTAPSSAGTYISDWQMVHEKIRWFGGVLTKKITIGGADTTAPGLVSNLTATIADREVTLNWTNPNTADFTGTRIRYSTSSFPTSYSGGSSVCDRKAAPGSTDSYTHSGLANGTTYYYSAFTYDGVPRYSTSVSVSALPSDVTPPGPAQNFTVTGEDGRNVLMWMNPADSDFAGMRILFKTTGFPTNRDDGTVIYSGTGASFIHTGLTNGTVYYYAAYAFDAVPNYSVVSKGSAAPAAGAEFNEVFAYPNGSLSGNNGWVGAAINQIEIIDQTVKINGALGTWMVDRPAVCFPDANGVIWLHARVKSGYGSDNMWGLWLDDASGVNLARWYGSGSTARGRIGPTISVTTAQDLTGGWDSIAARVDVFANTTEFFFNGVSLGVFSHYIADNFAGNTIAKVKVERMGNALATGHSMYLDSVFIGQVNRTPPSPVTAFDVIEGNQINNLMWTNPTDSDFAGTMVRYKIDGYPISAVDGTKVYDGTGTSFTHTGLINGTTYYYSAFAYDGFPDFSIGTGASATPIYFDPAQAKLLANNTPLTLTAGIVSASFTDRLYVQCADKPVGIRVDKNAHGLSEGQSIGVKGTVLTDTVNNEKYILATWARANGTGSIDPIGMGNPALGGVNWNYIDATGAGQKGIYSGVGPNNMGVLVRVWGTVTQRDTAGLGYFYINDGSLISDGTKTGIEDNVGVRISANPTGYAEGNFVIITGVVSCFKDANGNMRRMILPRPGGIQQL